MKMTEPCNLGLLALISAAGEISYEELKQRYLPPEQPGVITEKNAFDFQQLVTDVVEDAAELPENPTEKKDKD